MPKQYKQKLKKIEATEWLADGDHPGIEMFSTAPDLPCELCGLPLVEHGLIKASHAAGPAGDRVCPGDYIVDKLDGKIVKQRKSDFESNWEE